MVEAVQTKVAWFLTDIGEYDVANDLLKEVIDKVTVQHGRTSKLLADALHCQVFLLYRKGTWSLLHKITVQTHTHTHTHTHMIRLQCSLGKKLRAVLLRTCIAQLFAYFERNIFKCCFHMNAYSSNELVQLYVYFEKKHF